MKGERNYYKLEVEDLHKKNELNNNTTTPKLPVKR